MHDDGAGDRDAELSASVIQGMISTLRPGWELRDVIAHPEGVNAVVTVSVVTSAGDRRAVLKATTADCKDSKLARAEPRFLSRLADTDVPVPALYGYRDDHERYPAPFVLMEHVEGEPPGVALDRGSPPPRDRIVADAGRHLGALHELGTLPAVGHVGVRGGELAIVGRDNHPRRTTFDAWLEEYCSATLDAVTTGGWFPDSATEPARFADLVPVVRPTVTDRIANLPQPAPPRYCHRDYRGENLVVDPESGATRAVLDWQTVVAADPAFNLATTEFQFFGPDGDIVDDRGVDRPDVDSNADAAERTARLRRRFRRAYGIRRVDWVFDDAVRERMRTYRIVCLLDAMACFPIWYGDRSPEGQAKMESRLRQCIETALDVAES